MKQLISIPFQYKVIFAFLLLINVSIFFTGYTAKSMTEAMLLAEKEKKLITLARTLDSRLGGGGYAAILERHAAEHAAREEKIRVLNEELRDETDTVASLLPGLGVGYYSRDLDAILTYGPSASFGNVVGVSIAKSHPGQEVMNKNTVMVRSGSMVRGDIMNAMVPIERGGKVIGYIWANELTTEISAQFARITRNFTLIMLLCSAVAIMLLLLLSRRAVRDANRIINGVRAMRRDLSTRIEVRGGEFGEVAANINAMAEEIGKANAETARAVAVLRSVMGNVDASVYVCDPETKRVIYTNEYLSKLLGGRNLEGELCYEVFQGRMEPCPFCPQKQLFDADGEPIFSPFRWETHNPLIDRDFLVMDRLVTWPDGRLVHMEVGTDITDRNALALAEAANQAQREFLARMSHEIRTPMNGVLGMTRLALQASPAPEQHEYLRKIESSASLLLGIINDILDFSRIEAGKMSVEKGTFNLHEAVENIRELIAPRIREKDLKFVVIMDESVPEYVVGDKLRLSQVLLNLLGNAAKFTLEGRISLTLRARTMESGSLRLDCTVRDTGIGMDIGQQDALFQPFSQADSSTSRKFGGTGLGLSICKALVELMGGSILVCSEQGKGSVFSFFVELEPAIPPENGAEHSGEPWDDVSYTGCAFLLVEDNLINQEIAKAVLSELGAEVDIADNGERGVKAFLERDYDAVFMDVRMPVMDGLEATRRIRASGKHDATVVPVIAMTANAMQEDRVASLEAGMNGHIAKPLDVRELKRTLYRCLPAGARRGSSLPA